MHKVIINSFYKQRFFIFTLKNFIVVKTIKWLPHQLTNRRYIFEQELSDDRYETVYLVKDTQENNSP